MGRAAHRHVTTNINTWVSRLRCFRRRSGRVLRPAQSLTEGDSVALFFRDISFCLAPLTGPTLNTTHTHTFRHAASAPLAPVRTCLAATGHSRAELCNDVRET